MHGAVSTQHHDAPVAIKWIGLPGSFGAVTTFTDNVQGDTLTTEGDSTYHHEPGKMAFFHSIASDGTIIWGGQPFTYNVFQPSGLGCNMYTYDPDIKRLLTHKIQTSMGYDEVESVAIADVGGADIEDVVVYEHDGEIRAMGLVARDHNEWSLATYGKYPVFPVLKLVGSTWQYDASLSSWAEDIRASNVGEASDIWRNVTTSITAESTVATRHPSEGDRLTSGDIVIGHYDDQPGLSQRGGGLSVISSDHDLLQTYLFPNVVHPMDGATLLTKPRNIIADPTSDPTHPRFMVIPDVFGGRIVMYLDGSTNTAINTPDSAVWNVVGELRMIIRLKLPDWTPAASSFLIGHNEPTGNQRSWSVFLTPTGALQFTASVNGTAATVNTTSSVSSITDGSDMWLEIKYNTATGALSFKKATGSDTIPTTWTTISTHTVTATALFNSTAAVSIGATGSFLASRLTGTVYRAVVYDDGVAILDADFADASPALSTYTDSLGNVWTQRGNCRFVNTGQFMTQEFEFDTTDNSISAVSAPFYCGFDTMAPNQIGFDERGNLWVIQMWKGIFNGTVCVYEKSTVTGERSYVTAHPATTSAWLNGDASSTSEWAITATPDYQIAAAAIGGLASTPAWDNARKIMWFATPTAGVLGIKRSGAQGSLTFAVNQYTLRESSLSLPAGQSKGFPKVVVDDIRGVVWVQVPHSRTAYVPETPYELAQWMIRVVPRAA